MQALVSLTPIRANPHPWEPRMERKSLNTRARLALTSRLLRLPLLPIIRLWLLLAGSDPAWILVAHLVVPVLLAILLAVLLRKLATTGNVLPLAPVHVVETSRAWSLSLHSPKTF